MAGPTDPGRSDRRPETRSLAARLGERLGADVDPDVCLDPDPGAAPSAEVLRRLATHSPQGTRYAVRGEIARGGMGVILRVRDEDLRRNLAMKVMLGQGEAAGEGDTPEVDPALLTRFLEEAQLTGQLDHPGIVPVHELGLDADGRVYFTMRLVKGRELKEILAGEGDESWSRTRTLGVFLRICETLAYAHEKGVIHRDLKPANVMVGRFGEVYVMDWGLAKLLDREDDRDLRVKEPESSLVRTDRHDAISDDLDSPLMTMAGTVVGTPTYMSPEQASGRVEDLGPKSDVYAVGAMLYHLLAGHQPYVKPGERVSPLTVLNAVRNGPPQPIHEIDPRVPAELVAICEKAMARELDERYASMAELAEDLRRYLEDRVVLAHRTGALIELRKWVARNRLAAGTAAAALVLVAGLTVFFLQRVTRQRDRAVAAERNEREERRRADEARGRAVEERNQKDVALRDAKALALAAASKNEESDDTMLALLLAREAARRSPLPAVLSQVHSALFACRERFALVGHTRLVSAAYFSPSGDRILTSSEDGTVRLWTRDGKNLAVLRELPFRTRVLWLPDGESFLTHELDEKNRGPVCIRAADGALRATFPGEWSLAMLHAGGQHLLTESDQELCIWDLEGRRICTLRGEKGTRLLQLSDDGELACSTQVRQGVVRVWSTSGHEVSPDPSSETSDQRGLPGVLALGFGARDDLTMFGRVFSLPLEEGIEIQASQNPVAMVLPWISPAGDSVLTLVFGEGAANLWDPGGGHLRKIGTGKEPLAFARMTRDGEVLTLSWNGMLRRWSKEGAPLAAWQTAAVGQGAASTFRDGEYVLTWAGAMKTEIWTRDGVPVLSLPGSSSPVGLSRDGRLMLAAGDDGLVRALELEQEPRDLATWRLDTAAGSGCKVVPTSPDRFLVIQSNRAALWDITGRMVHEVTEDEGGSGHEVRAEVSDGRLLNVVDKVAHVRSLDGERSVTLDGHDEPIRAAALRTTADRAATASSDGSLRLWDLEGRLLAEWKDPSGEVKDVRLSESADRILSGGSDGAVRLWKSDGTLLRTLRPECRDKERPYSRGVFSPCGGWIVAWADSDPVLYDRNGETVATLTGHEMHISEARFSSSGDAILTYTQWSARLWDLRGRQLREIRHGPSLLLIGARLAPDSSRVLTYGRDARIWTEDGRWQELRVKTGPIVTADFLADGKKVVGVTWEGRIHVWCVDPEDLLRLVDERVTRDFTPEERVRYRDLLEEPSE
jgi:serine/threonine protein kinase/WD40 repeat protein